MPKKKAAKPSAKAAAPAKSKSQERRETALSSERHKVVVSDKVLDEQAARSANANGELADREIFELEILENAEVLQEGGKEVAYPRTVGYGFFVRGQLFDRRRELSVPSHAEHAKKLRAACLESILAFEKTVKDPTDDVTDNIA